MTTLLRFKGAASSPMDATTGADSRAMAGKFLHSSTRFIMPVEPKMRAGMTRVNGGPATVTPGPVPVSVEPEMPVDYASFDMPSLGPWSHVLWCGLIWIICMLWASTIRVRLQPRIILSEGDYSCSFLPLAFSTGGPMTDMSRPTWMFFRLKTR
jgi:hypothetical protein